MKFLIGGAIITIAGAVFAVTLVQHHHSTLLSIPVTIAGGLLVGAGLNIASKRK